MGNIILIGFMGCGKSSVGKKLAEKLNYCFCDVDRMIERDNKKSISEIFETEGEEYFRELETKTVKELITTVNNCIISVGGGLPIKAGNRELLKALGSVVFLKIRKETILKRLEFDKTRPLLASDDREKKIDELLLYREPIYIATADIIVEVDDKEFEQILDEICNGVKVVK
jgi:shikimate kinase